MFSRYIITILKAGESLTDPIVKDPNGARRIELPGFCIVIETPDGHADEALTIDMSELPRRLTITDGALIHTGTNGLLQTGSYNQLIVDADAGVATLHNDTLGILPCYFSTTGGPLRVSNSIPLLREAAALPVDELGVVEIFLFSGWAIFERTILKGGRRMAAGTEYRFQLGSGKEPAATRLAETWTMVLPGSTTSFTDQFCDLWRTSIERHFGPIDAPIGMMLSGGLDSRLVAGGVAALGKPMVAMTHGNLSSNEVGFAAQVVQELGIRWITNGLDDDYPFERMALDDIKLRREAFMNPIWYSSAQCLAAEGVSHFATGAGFDSVFGGMKDLNPYRRLLTNLRHSVLGPGSSKPLSAQGVREIVDLFRLKARKRARNHIGLLAEPYRSLITDTMPAVDQEVSDRLEAMAQTTPTAAQLLERFEFEHWVRQFTAMQERQLEHFGRVYLPTYDRDLLAFLTNLQPAVKYDHHLYYRVIRRLYPKLARIPITNLGTSPDKPQLQIEMSRAWRIWRKKRLTAWINYETWIRSGNRLDNYERLFLGQSHFFDCNAIRPYFDDVRAGRKHIYDGNEMLSFLTLAYHLNDNLAAA